MSGLSFSGFSQDFPDFFFPCLFLQPLLFGISLFFCSSMFSLFFCASSFHVHPFISKDFKGSAKRKNPCFLGCFPQGLPAWLFLFLSSGQHRRSHPCLCCALVGAVPSPSRKRRSCWTSSWRPTALSPSRERCMQMLRL